jgi:SHS family lactate transporter-like MFS transporter
MNWTRNQRNVVIAAFLGWTLDAFDFYLMVFMLGDIAVDLHSGMQGVSTAILLTLGMRPLGAVLFGRLADRFGRKSTLMWNILAYSVLEAASGFSSSMSALLVVRSLFGVAMGGEWGIGSALAMETIPASSRGFVSGLLQSGNPTGFLLASVAVYCFYDTLGWRYMFMLGLAPAALVYFIRRGVEESPAWREHQQDQDSGSWPSLRRNWKLAIYAIVLMTAFNFLGHGSQDAYPNLFLKVQHHFDTHLSSLITAIANLGAICGGLALGWYSETIGRRRAIVLASLMALAVLPVWAFASTPLTLAFGAFSMQFAVQGAWGVIPAHLNELSPPEIRATFPGFVYQLGNLFAASNLNIQVAIAERHGDNYAMAMASVVAVVALLIALLAAFGPERRGINLNAPLSMAPSAKS